MYRLGERKRDLDDIPEGAKILWKTHAMLRLKWGIFRKGIHGGGWIARRGGGGGLSTNHHEVDLIQWNGVDYYL